MGRLVRLGMMCVMGVALGTKPMLYAQSPAAEKAAPSGSKPQTILRTTVRRVVLDVVVTDREGAPVPGLTKDDFQVVEDGQPQTVLSFEASGFNAGMDYVPPKLPPQPPNTFMNLPTTPEKGPLYVLLYDMVNMDNEDQMALTANQHSDQIFGRQQLVKFIQSKPEGSRFAIYVWSDGLHMLQGFTSDKAELYAAIDPRSSRAHIPEVFLTGENQGRGNGAATASILRQLASDLDGLPGRKNLIWFSGGFPLSFAVTNMDGPKYTEEIKATLDLLASNQVAIYPVDVRGVVYTNGRTFNGLEEDGPTVSQRYTGGTPPPSQVPGAPGGPPADPLSSHAGYGGSLIRGSYFGMETIAEETGGRAFYSTNDVAGELVNATEAGEAYYTLTYSPTNHDYGGRLRHISVKLEEKGYTVAYRRSYYGTERPEVAGSLRKAKAGNEQPAGPQRGTGDTLSANMRHGGPMAHGLVFAVQVHAAGAPGKATAQQMAELATQPAFSGAAHRGSVSLQRYLLSYRIFGRQFKDASGGLNLELAAAAFDADGHRLNSSVNVSNGAGGAAEGAAAGASEPAKVYRVDEEFEVPVGATSLRFAVRDAATDRIGAMEIKLPLAPEGPAGAAVQ